MAALLLSTAGAAAGGAVFGPTGAIAGRLIGALAGNAIDRALFSSHRDVALEGPRLADLTVMASTEGAPIARVYGRARLAGQVIWATHLQEVLNTRSETTGGGGGGKGGGRSGTTTTTTTYSYFANLAVGLCEGPIGGVMRVWADGKPLDLSGLTVRVHRGDETQTPDPLVVAKEGDAPAYRGLAYVVFERLPLEKFGNRIPQLSFEIVRPVGRLEQMVRAVTLIPGATEFGYQPATVVQVAGPGQSTPENRHISYAPSDVIASLDELQAVAPNIERVAVIVAWFGDDLRCGQCRIQPAVDSGEKTTHGDSWSVAELSRDGARRVSLVEGRPAFGGTPSDSSVRALIAELKTRGLKVTLYPFLMMDIAAGNVRRSMERRVIAAGLSLARPYHLRSRAGPAGLTRRRRAGGRPGGCILCRWPRWLELPRHDPALRVTGGECRRRRCISHRFGIEIADPRAIGIRRLSGGRRTGGIGFGGESHPRQRNGSDLRRGLDRIRRACGRSLGR